MVVIYVPEKMQYTVFYDNCRKLIVMQLLPLFGKGKISGVESFDF